jgi:cytochrome c biogenesis protein CcmG/thiol:disulfide interchange protein DsbE
VASSWQRIATAVVLAAAAGYAGFLLAPVVAPKPAPPAVAAKTTGQYIPVGLAVGDYPPNFTLEDVHGRMVTLSSLRGHPVWLNFWATWCPWCRTEMPDMEKVHEMYGSRLLIYGIDLQESRATVSRWLAQHGITYDVLLDSTGQVATTYDVSQLPTSIFIAPNGRIIAIHTGELLSVQAMLTLVRQAMGQ